MLIYIYLCTHQILYNFFRLVFFQWQSIGGKFYFLSKQLCFTLIILNDKTFTQPLQVLFLLSLASLVTVSWTGLLCVWSALLFYQVSITSRGLSFWRLSEDHTVNHSLEEGVGGGTVRVTPAREIKRACPGLWLRPGFWDRAGVTWVRWAREQRSAHQREGHAGPLTDARHGPASSDLTPATDHHETGNPVFFPEPGVTDPSPAFSRGALSCVWPGATSKEGGDPGEQPPSSRPMSPPTTLDGAGSSALLRSQLSPQTLGRRRTPAFESKNRGLCENKTLTWASGCRMRRHPAAYTDSRPDPGTRTASEGRLQPCPASHFSLH